MRKLNSVFYLQVPVHSKPNIQLHRCVFTINLPQEITRENGFLSLKSRQNTEELDELIMWCIFTSLID